MGQQQLLLVILGVLIVGVAVAVGIILFNDSALDNNRDTLQNDLALIAAKAQEYYFKPQSMAGGGHSFIGLTADASGMALLVSPQFSNNDQGTYTISTAGDAALVIITGVGKVQLPDGSFPTYNCRVRERKYLTQLVN